jgi:hypothetical protein
MAEMTSLEDVLSDKPNEVAKPDPVEKQQAERNEEKPATTSSDYEGTRKKHRREEYAAQGRDPDTGQFVEKAEEKVEAKPETKVEAKVEVKPEVKEEVKKPPVQEFTDKERAFLKAAEEERRKRQGLERELSELRAKAPATEPAKTFWDDPEAALKTHERKMADLTTQTRLQTSETIAKSRYADFDEKLSIFTELVTQTPGLVEQMMQSQDPADFAYRTAKNHKELRDAGDIDSLRAKIEKETRIKIEAELKEKAEALQKERAALPTSLSDVRGTSKQLNRPVWNGPQSLEEILKG